MCIFFAGLWNTELANALILELANTYLLFLLHGYACIVLGGFETAFGLRPNASTGASNISEEQSVDLACDTDNKPIPKIAE